MTDLTTWIATIAGGGGALALISGGLLYVTKEAIAKAVTQAGNREIERLKGDLASQLEEKKQAFTRELERERREADTTLEQFKAQLTFEAEVRRHAAAKKVEALLKIAAVAKAAVESVYTLSRDDSREQRQ